MTSHRIHLLHLTSTQTKPPLLPTFYPNSTHLFLLQSVTESPYFVSSVSAAFAMSAPPSGPPGSAGPTPNSTGPTPPGTGPPRRRPMPRHKPDNNPLVVKKKKAPLPPPGAPFSNATPPSLTGPGPSLTGPSITGPGHAAPPPAPAARSSFVQREPSPVPVGPPQVFKLYLRKKDLVRLHLGKFHSKEEIDLEDRTRFEAPVYLHRRETGQFATDGDPMDIDSKESLTDQQEKERQEAIKQDRARQREDMSKDIAPSASSKRKAAAFKKKTEQVFRTNETKKEREQNRLRYEEALPWHIEDSSGKEVWVGQYEEALSHRYILLTPKDDDPNAYIVTPVEKFYRFKKQSKAKQMSIEEVEKIMASKSKEPRWLTRDKERVAKEKKAEASRSRMVTRRGDEKNDDEDGMNFREITANADEIDFNLEEEFADDEENPLFEGDDEETKEAEERMRKDQLEANTFGLGDEQKVDEEELAKQKADDAKKVEGMATSRLLQKREKRMDHEEISGQSDQSDSDSDESENANDDRQREAGKAVADKTNGKEGEKIGSGASSKGTNTPSGRKKTTDPLPRQASTNSLKRSAPGSGNLSDASGNESSRPGKKAKKDSNAQVQRTSNMPGTKTATNGEINPVPSLDRLSVSARDPVATRVYAPHRRRRHYAPRQDINRPWQFQVSNPELSTCSHGYPPGQCRVGGPHCFLLGASTY